MSWSKRLSIGNADIDNDHKKLIEVYNDLVDLIELKKGRSEFARILSEMTDYSLQHFLKEEAYMKEFGYPHFEQHKRAHDEYRYRIAMYNFDLLGINPPAPVEIISYLENWWTNHILYVDTKYEKFKKENNSGANYKAF